MLSGDHKIVKFEEYPTRDEGYEAFVRKLNFLVGNGYEVSVAVEPTENTRYFKNREPFNELKMAYSTKYMEMQAEALNVALDEEASALL